MVSLDRYMDMDTERLPYVGRTLRSKKQATWQTRPAPLAALPALPALPAPVSQFLYGHDH